MPSFALLSVLLALGALFSFLSYRVLRLPTTIGTMLLSLAAASAVILGGRAIPVLPGEKVMLQVSPCDLSKERITCRAE